MGEGAETEKCGTDAEVRTQKRNIRRHKEDAERKEEIMNRLTEVFVKSEGEFPFVDATVEYRLKKGVTEQQAIDRLFKYETMDIADWAYMIRKKLTPKQVEYWGEDEMHCPDCNAAVMDYEAKYCVYCGRALQVKPDVI